MSEKMTPVAENEYADIEQKAQALLEEKDSEARTRTYTGWFNKLVTVGLCLWTVLWVCPRKAHNNSHKTLTVITQMR